MSKSSILRTNPDACPLAAKCGGCQLQNLTYDKQLQFKQVKEIKLLGRFHHVDEIIGMDEPYHYRNKVQAAFGTDAHGKIISGVYQSSTHRIVNVSDCMLEDVTADKIIADIRTMMPRFKMTAYDERRQSGWLRHVLVKRSFSRSSLRICRTTRDQALKGKSSCRVRLLVRSAIHTRGCSSRSDGTVSLGFLSGMGGRSATKKPCRGLERI